MLYSSPVLGKIQLQNCMKNWVVLVSSTRYTLYQRFKHDRINIGHSVDKIWYELFVICEILIVEHMQIKPPTNVPWKSISLADMYALFFSTSLPEEEIRGRNKERDVDRENRMCLQPVCCHSAVAVTWCLHRHTSTAHCITSCSAGKTVTQIHEHRVTYQVDLAISTSELQIVPTDRLVCVCVCLCVCVCVCVSCSST